MNLSKRLSRLADMITEGNRLADVGTDHGYVPIYLMQQGRIPSAVAMDINKGPLERARLHIREYGLEAYIETRLSDGLAQLKKGEADSILAAGMGGALIVRILENGREALLGVSELVLQPQSEIVGVRRWLLENGYRITAEDIVLDEGKYYPMMRAVPERRNETFGEGEAPEEKPGAGEALGSEKQEGMGGIFEPAWPEAYSEGDYRFGRLELQRSPDTFRAYLENGIRIQRQILSALPEGGDKRIAGRRAAVEAELALLEERKRALSLLTE